MSNKRFQGHPNFNLTLTDTQEVIDKFGHHETQVENNYHNNEEEDEEKVEQQEQKEHERYKAMDIYVEKLNQEMEQEEDSEEEEAAYWKTLARFSATRLTRKRKYNQVLQVKPMVTEDEFIESSSEEDNGDDETNSNDRQRHDELDIEQEEEHKEIVESDDELIPVSKPTRCDSPESVNSLELIERPAIANQSKRRIVAKPLKTNLATSVFGVGNTFTNSNEKTLGSSSTSPSSSSSIPKKKDIRNFLIGRIVK